MVEGIKLKAIDRLENQFPGGNYAYMLGLNQLKQVLCLFMGSQSFNISLCYMCCYIPTL